MSDYKKQLLDDLDPISTAEIREDDWVKLESSEYKVDMVTYPGDPANGAGLINGAWIPKWALKCDFDGNLYIKGRIYSEKFG